MDDSRTDYPCTSKLKGRQEFVDRDARIYQRNYFIEYVFNFCFVTFSKKIQENVITYLNISLGNVGVSYFRNELNVNDSELFLYIIDRSKIIIRNVFLQPMLLNVFIAYLSLNLSLSVGSAWIFSIAMEIALALVRALRSPTPAFQGPKNPMVRLTMSGPDAWA